MECAVSPSEQGIFESKLLVAATHQALMPLIVKDTPQGFMVVAKLNWAKDTDWFLTTRRNRNSPRFFKSLDRLNEHLRTIAPTVPVQILRH